MKRIALRLSIGSFFAVNAVLLLLGLMVAATYGLPDYLYLHAKGGSMYPTIKDGDQVKVKMCSDGDRIDDGDIIVYCSIATGSVTTGSMWIGHRVIRKFQEEGKWYFQTQGDNCSDPDPWTVPEHFLLGKVVGIAHTASTPNVQPSQTSYKSNTSFESRVWSWLGISLLGCSIAGVTIVLRKRAKTIKTLRQAMVMTCQSCIHFQVHTTFSAFVRNGRFGIRKQAHFPRGFCKKYNREIRNCCQKPTCSAYASKVDK